MHPVLVDIEFGSGGPPPVSGRARMSASAADTAGRSMLVPWNAPGPGQSVLGTGRRRLRIDLSRPAAATAKPSGIRALSR
ncbi:hypothetical protein ABIA38_007930 [Embleya sp. AB8]